MRRSTDCWILLLTTAYRETAAAPLLLFDPEFSRARMGGKSLAPRQNSRRLPQIGRAFFGAHEKTGAFLKIVNTKR